MLEQVIRDAVRCLGQAAPGATIILFGSAARGKMTSGSDLDFLVVMPTVTHHASEMARLRAALQPVIGPHFIPADVLVASQAEYEHWQDTPGTVYYEAAHSGYVLAPAA